jgi:hypothetical protein
VESRRRLSSLSSRLRRTVALLTPAHRSGTFPEILRPSGGNAPMGPPNPSPIRTIPGPLNARGLVRGVP